MQFQRFHDGSSSVREKLNRMVDALNVLTALRGDEEFLEVNWTASGVTVALDLAAVLARVPRKPPEAYWAVITGNVALGEGKWRYTVSSRRKATAGASGWDSDGLFDDATAYNAAEELNSSTRLRGSVDLTQTDALGTVTLTILPIPSGQPVLVRPSVLDDRTFEYVFSMPNDVTATEVCE